MPTEIFINYSPLMPFCPVCNKYFDRRSSLRQHADATNHRGRRNRGRSLPQSTYWPGASGSAATLNVGPVSVIEVSASEAPANYFEPADMSDDATENSFEMILPSAFNCSDFSDIKLFLGTEEFELPAHRLILASRSPYFQNAFKSDTVESSSGEVRLKDYSTHALWRVFEHVYTNSYSDEAPSHLSMADDAELMRHPRVYFLADMFQMQDLKRLAAEKFKDQLHDAWASESLTECIQEIYNNTTDSLLTNALMDVLETHIVDLNLQSAFTETVKAVADFALDLVITLGCAVGRKDESSREWQNDGYDQWGNWRG